MAIENSPYISFIVSTVSLQGIDERKRFMEIRIENLQKSYGKKQALKNVNLNIKSGMFGLLGPNGAGKTTLMKIITTLTKKTAGNVDVCMVPVENSKKIREMTGYLPQEFSMYGNMTAYEALDYLAVLSGLSRKERKEKVPDAEHLRDPVRDHRHHRTPHLVRSGWRL